MDNFSYFHQKRRREMCIPVSTLSRPAQLDGTHKQQNSNTNHTCHPVSNNFASKADNTTPMAGSPAVPRFSRLPQSEKIPLALIHKSLAVLPTRNERSFFFRKPALLDTCIETPHTGRCPAGRSYAEPAGEGLAERARLWTNKTHSYLCRIQPLPPTMISTG